MRFFVSARRKDAVFEMDYEVFIRRIEHKKTGPLHFEAVPIFVTIQRRSLRPLQPHPRAESSAGAPKQPPEHP
jgi:hypothetical protein